MSEFDYAVVDYQDEFVLYAGTFIECMQVQAEGYGGLTVVPFRDVEDWPITSFDSNIPNNRKPFYFYGFEDE